MTKRCKYCGQFFVPDPRTLKTQKACARPECRKARKREANETWRKNNPVDCKNHYIDYIVPGREKEKMEKEKHRSYAKPREKVTDKMKDRIPKMIKDEIPPSNPLLELVLLIPADTAGMIKDEIRLRKVDSHRFAAYG